MTAVFTNRLVGTAILVVAAVVFLPDLLDGQKQVRKDDFKAVPERPEFAEVSQPAVFSQDQHQGARDAALKPATDNSQPLDVPAPAGTETTLPDQEYASVATDQPQAIPDTDPQPAQSAAQPQSVSQSQSAQAAATQPSGSQQTAGQPSVNAPAAVVTAPPAAAKVEKPLSQAAYIVKVGSFSKEQNANALVSKLKAAGYSAFTKKVVTATGTTMVSVIVGPDLKKEKLESRLTELQQLAQVSKLKVTAYQPVENN